MLYRDRLVVRSCTFALADTYLSFPTRTPLSLRRYTRYRTPQFL